MKITVAHSVNGATKIAVFEAPRISRQMVDGGLHLILRDNDWAYLGTAMFTTGGLACLDGLADEQYQWDRP